MEGFIDIHSHILPKLDDGSQSMEQTKRMLQIAYEEGIRTIVATPHYHEGRYVNPVETIVKTVVLVNEQMKDICPQMQIYLGSEIYYSHDCVKLLNNKKIPTMAESRYILVEFSPMADYQYIKKGLQEFLLGGYFPILAHVERYQNIIKEINLVGELIEMGAYIQVNSISIIGKPGRAIQKAVKKILKMNYIHFIATDSHSEGSRAPRLQACAKYISKKYDEAYARELLIDNPNKLLYNSYV